MWTAIAGAAIGLGSQLISGLIQSNKQKEMDKIMKDQYEQNRAYFNANNMNYLDTEEGRSSVRKMSDMFKEANERRTLFGGTETEESRLAQKAEQNKALGGLMNDLSGRSTAYKQNLWNNWQNAQNQYNNYQMGVLASGMEQAANWGNAGAQVGTSIISAFAPNKSNNAPTAQQAYTHPPVNTKQPYTGSAFIS